MVFFYRFLRFPIKIIKKPKTRVRWHRRMLYSVRTISETVAEIVTTTIAMTIKKTPMKSTHGPVQRDRDIVLNAKRFGKKKTRKLSTGARSHIGILVSVSAPITVSVL